MPDVGEGLTEAEVLEWKVAPGDDVAVNQIIVEIETAKAAVELPSPYAGKVHQILVEPGVTVDVGTPIITVDTDPGAGPLPDSAPAPAAAPAAAEAGEGGAKIGEAQADGRIATLVGLVAGKLIGVLGTTALVTRFTPFRLPDAIGLRDLLPIAFLCGIGFTVSLLITELSFEDGGHFRAAKVGILAGSLLAAALGAVLLRWDARMARSVDMNADGVPDQDAAVIGDDDSD